MNYELTDQLIELENIQREYFLNRARGQQASELLDYYEVPKYLYSLMKEPPREDNPEHARRTIVRFNFGLLKEEDRQRMIECLFFLGHSPDFIAEALGDDLKTIAAALIRVIQESRAKRAAELRANPQRFRIIK